jgi:glycosyltransferase involved in cell wall biosynthesis
LVCESLQPKSAREIGGDELTSKVAAVIPAFNEEATIAAVVRRIASSATVLVVDDGCSDNTAAAARIAGATVLHHLRNLGYDAALATGLHHAIDNGFELAVTLDADGQHSPESLSRFVDELTRGADLVVGVRERTQRISERLFAVVARNCWSIEDPLCGMKGYRLAKFAHAARFDRYQSIGTHYALVAARSGLRIAQIPVPIAPRTGTPRFGSGLRANWKIFRALIVGIVLARQTQ